jgi:hypothetical protein
MRRGLFPHAGLIAQTLIFFGVARMYVAVGIGFAGSCHDRLENTGKRVLWQIVGRLEVEAKAWPWNICREN